MATSTSIKGTCEISVHQAKSSSTSPLALASVGRSAPWSAWSVGWSSAAVTDTANGKLRGSQDERTVANVHCYSPNEFQRDGLARDSRLRQLAKLSQRIWAEAHMYGRMPSSVSSWQYEQLRPSRHGADAAGRRRQKAVSTIAVVCPPINWKARWVGAKHLREREGRRRSAWCTGSA